ncbi:hypothetical protein THIOKS1160028 [Thiocapsa sp. KS1]|nr:hypothetical protein THIOKS1160028 [Thiocapsa sp. KS1]
MQGDRFRRGAADASLSPRVTARDESADLHHAHAAEHGGEDRHDNRKQDGEDDDGRYGRDGRLHHEGHHGPKGHLDVDDGDAVVDFVHRGNSM